MACRKKRLYFGAAVLAAACFPTDQEADPPLGELYFPVGAALGADGERLYIANSDFDLHFSQGTLTVLDAGALRDHVPTSCRTDADCASGRCDSVPGSLRDATFLCLNRQGELCEGRREQSVAERNAMPGPCEPLPLSSELLLDSARIAPFATDLEYVRFEDSKGKNRARLLMPARGDASLHWADVEYLAGDGPVLDCGQARTRECDDHHRVGGDSASESGLLLPEEPTDLATTEDGSAALLAHQTTGEVSLFLNEDAAPRLEYVMAGLAPGLQSLARIPQASWAPAEQKVPPGFLATFRRGDVPVVELIRYQSEGAAGPYLERGGASLLRVSSSGVDSRGIALDDAERRDCEAQCPAQDCAADADDCTSCLETCSRIPVDVFIANRSPAALLVGQTRPTSAAFPTDDLAGISDLIPLRGGPSVVVVAGVKNALGESERRVFVLAFDSNELFVVDPSRRSLELRIRTGPGPAAWVVDEKRALGYLVHFSNSTLGVIDLDSRHASYGKYLLTVASSDLGGAN